MAPGLSSSLIHAYPCPTPTAPSPVLIISQSPAVDVVGVGCLDGSIRILDIRSGEYIMKMTVDDGGVTGLSFRIGGSDPVLC